MTEAQPLPVRFHAACAVEKVLRNDVAKEFLVGFMGLGTMIQSYLTLMNEVDNEEVVAAFE